MAAILMSLDPNPPMLLALADYLDEAARRPFVWGQSDCMLLAADWAARLTGRDPAAPWRHTYANAEQATAIVAAQGGHRALLRHALARTGWHSVEVPAPGDIGLVLALTHGQAITPVGGVCFEGPSAAWNGRFAVRTARGLLMGPASTLELWRHG